MKSTSSFNLAKSRYPILEVPGGIRVDAPVAGGKLVGTKRSDGSYRRQCGEYVNDVIGIPSYFGDTLSSKKVRIVPNATPAPGSIGVMDTGKDRNGKPLPGHVFVFERIITPVRFTISESNPFDTETWRRIDTTMDELKKRGYIGCTQGLDMTPERPEWEVKAIDWAKSKGIASMWHDPDQILTHADTAQMFFNAGLLKVLPTGADGKTTRGLRKVELAEMIRKIISS